MSFSDEYKQLLSSTNRREMPIVLIEMVHPAANNGLLFAVYDCDIISNGRRYLKCAARVGMPKDDGKELPRSEISISNLGGDACRLIERTHGAKNMRVIVSEVLPSRPDIIERSFDFELRSITITPNVMTMQLGYDDVLNANTSDYLFSPTTHKGLF